MIIIFDRESCCMGDDMANHYMEIEVDEHMLLSELLDTILKVTDINELPSSRDIRLGIRGHGDIVGRYIRKEYKKATMEVVGKDIPVCQLSDNHLYVYSRACDDALSCE
ncbi:hypothetical protein [Bacteroides heparinolyticus]|uniref:hypothetical protein n=1 Tax=Prevotella heparinolytica TaxID=28113 RepID=UPI0023F49534|nr:hypothetical protein [Bacteroides heparinolyticus]